MLLILPPYSNTVMLYRYFEILFCGLCTIVFTRHSIVPSKMPGITFPNANTLILFQPCYLLTKKYHAKPIPLYFCYYGIWNMHQYS